MRKDSGLRRNEETSYSRSPRYGFGSIATKRSPWRRMLWWWKSPWIEPSRPTSSDGVELARERDQLAAFVAFVRVVDPRGTWSPIQRNGSPAGRQSCVRDVDGDRGRGRPPAAPRCRHPEARAPRAARGALGRVRSRRTAPFPSHSSSASRLVQRLVVSVPRHLQHGRRRPVRRTSSARARTARRARAPTPPRSLRRSPAHRSRSTPSTRAEHRWGPRLRHPDPHCPATATRIDSAARTLSFPARRAGSTARGRRRSARARRRSRATVPAPRA